MARRFRADVQAICTQQVETAVAGRMPWAGLEGQDLPEADRLHPPPGRGHPAAPGGEHAAETEPRERASPPRKQDRDPELQRMNRDDAGHAQTCVVDLTVI